MDYSFRLAWLRFLDRVYRWVAQRFGDRLLYWSVMTARDRCAEATPVAPLVALGSFPVAPLDIERIKKACRTPSQIVVDSDFGITPFQTVEGLIQKLDQASR